MNKIYTLIYAAIIASLLVGCGKKSENAAPSTGSAPAATTESAQAAAPAVDNAALFYEQGRELRDGLKGVVDKAKAFELFSKSAELGNSGAMFFVGVMYANGESVHVDEQKALEWLEKSDKGGCGAAAPYMKELKARMAKKANKKK